MEINNIKNKLFSQNNLTAEESFFLFKEIMNGKLNEIDTSAILISLKIKGETKDEILGATKIMRSKSLKISSSANIVDTCGTGGDMSDTLNISTAASLVAASCGVTIAKHGNKSVSSKSGSADMLENIGYKFSDDPKKLEEQLKNNNFCFMFAQYHHSAMKHVISVRKTLGTRTIFNLLGPLTNPANAKNQLLGVYDKKWINTHCEVLNELGSNKVMIVHGFDGLDEITLSQNTYICELKDKHIQNYNFDPRDIGYDYISLEDIKGGDPKYNAECFMKMINGKYDQFQKIVEINAGAAVYLSGKASSIKEGALIAQKSITEGKTKNFISSITNE
ncbi:MAG: anthranilate phosphoribosyltransferase [Pelagibacteraceae bacterium]|jgi:anthranilate phosphoribosyltransferase|nr:anthranilate phosphoribosyltransferase [Pelagibacteraceae bacterium]MBT3901497.1 anthranilate phosphoribosyltransferase [Pelagibacteraceae bacterium]MBT4645942.1 anthranilate phosphoribosyltransferase [Pelagibacteraceae bacterium]MBT4951225.1 anthranilate phosphoribosyltransferase [Pelagibacteraceae bacterium]MBT6354535.1 anthranilate phosphoribosyltransferase [Pelagibacteraceae bacterium]